MLPAHFGVIKTEVMGLVPGQMKIIDSMGSRIIVAKSTVLL